MKINFNDIEEKTVSCFLGGTGEIKMKAFMDGNKKIMLLTLPKGSSLGFHKHEETSEIIRVISGVLTVKTDDGEEVLNEGEVHFCPKGFSHAARNDSDKDLVLYAVVL